MRILRLIIENIPIRYFMAIVIILATIFAFFIDYFVAQPYAKERAFSILERNLDQEIIDIRSHFTELLQQKAQTAIDENIILHTDKHAVVGFIILGANKEILFSTKSEDRNQNPPILPYIVNNKAFDQAFQSDEVVILRDNTNDYIQGYAGLTSQDGQAEKRYVLVLTKSISELLQDLQGVADFYFATLIFSLIGLALCSVLALSAKIHDRVRAILSASKELAAQKEDIDLTVEGSDEFGQIAESLRETSAVLAIRRQRLNEAIQRAEEANSTKSEFLSNMSHEIRTPMNGIISGLNLMQSTTSEDERQELLSASLGSAHALMDIINDILDFSKLEAGKLTISPVPFFLARTLKDARLLMNTLAAENGTTIELEMDEECENWILADEVRFRQILNNLLSNAVKFTQKGKITISATLTEKESPVLTVRIQDTGIGIKPKDLATLFDRFTQVKNKETRKSGGTGLGLAICQQLVELMGGSIHVESEVGKGSCFWFAIPVEMAQGHEVGEMDESQFADLHANILLAEDIPVNQMLISKMLQQLGHQVTVAPNGKEALEALEKNKFDIILMDNQMPEMSGMEAISAIRARTDGLANIPIIALTADAMIEQQDAFFEAGVDSFVSKPIAMDKLKYEITRLLHDPH